MKIEKKEYHGLPYEEVDSLYVKMDKIDFDMMTRYFDAVQKNAEASSKLLEALSEKIEALTEQNNVLKTMLVMEKPEEEDEIENLYDPCIGCPHEGFGSEHCAAVIGDYCRAGHGFIEDEE